MTDSPDKTCPVCLKPETAISGGFVTSFIDVCHCKSIRFQQNEVDGAPVRLCGNCHKPMTVGQREGSLTQWIFRFDSCKCEQPRPGPLANAPGVEARESSNLALENDAEAVPFIEEETELEVSQDQFPIERYIPRAILGQGASGIVYLATDRLLKKKVGVKILINLTGQQLIDFQNEAKLTSKLKHPNIIQVFDFGPTPSGMPYMVLEYSDRVLSLSQSLRENGPLQVGVAIEVFLKIADALAFAHGMGVYHRDLKPSNILFTYVEHQDITVKLIDFGVASTRRESLEPTISDDTTVVGTLGYMAPELAADKQFDARCEIYSLGCVLFEALTGRLPFVSDSPLAMLALHTNQIAPPLRTVAGVSFPVQIEQLVADCLAKDPEARPASAAVFKNRLQRCQLAIDASKAGDASAVSILNNQETVKSDNQPGPKFSVLAAAAVCAVTLIVVAMVSTKEIYKSEKTAVSTPTTPVEASPTALADQIYGTELTIQNTDVINLKAPNAKDITRIRITGCVIKDPSALSGVENFPKLRNLAITKTSGLSKRVVQTLCDGFSKIASDKRAFKAKNRLEKPLFLDFSDTDLDNSGLIPLQKLPSIASLTLAGTRVDDGVIDFLSTHEMIQAIDLSRTAISDNAVKKLATMHQLVLLRVSECPNLKMAKSAVLDHTTIVLDKSETEIDDEFPIYFQAAQAKNLRAYSNLASLYYLGKGVDRDFDEALKWYKKAAFAGNAGSNLTVGDFYRLGLVGGKPNNKEALKWYQIAAAKGSTIKAALRMGPIYFNGVDGKTPDYKEALKYFRLTAEAGSAQSEDLIGDCYYHGLGVPVNYTESLKWYHKSAKKGYGPAIYSLGLCYQEGLGVKKSDTQAFNYFSRAAAVGDEDGMYNSACLYMSGKGTAVDLRKAMQLFQKAAEKGHLEATTSVGYLYEKGIGVEIDYKEAFKWYQRAAASNENSNALLALGDLYRDGRGVAVNPTFAKSCYQRSAALGNETAKQRLGL